MQSPHPAITPSKLIPKLDRITICFDDPDPNSSKQTCNLLVTEHLNKAFPGMIIKGNARYQVSATIPLPFSSSAPNRHPVCFEAGPRHSAMASYRLDCNPAKLSPQALADLMVFIDTVTHATPKEFFGLGRVTRLDVALDIPGYSLDNVIVSTTRKQKHGVYSDRSGRPETVYLGTPRSARMVAYSKPNKDTGCASIRLESRLNPKCAGHTLHTLPNPFAKTLLLDLAILDHLSLPFPPQMLADSIRVRGLKHALEPLSAPTRKSIKHALASAQGDSKNRTLPGLTRAANQIL